MKKFIMTSPHQPEGKLRKGVYTAVDNEKLSYTKETGFPIIPMINGYASSGETIEVIVNLSDYKNARFNLELLKKELEELCSEKGINYTLKLVEIPYNNYIDTQLELFGKLVDVTSDSDTLYCCVSYGSKPVPIIQTMALNYALRVRKNVTVECIAYGDVDHNTGKMSIYDITSLLYLDETIRVMAEQKIENPIEKIRDLLN